MVRLLAILMVIAIPHSAGAVGGCRDIDLLTRIEGLFAFGRESAEMVAAEQELTKLTRDRGADQPRYYEEMRYIRLLSGEYLARGNAAAAIQLARPVMFEAYRHYAVIERSTELSARIDRLRNRLDGQVEISAEFRDELLRVARVIEPIEGAQRTVQNAAEAKDLIELLAARVVEQRVASERGIALVVDQFNIHWRAVNGSSVDPAPAAGAPNPVAGTRAIGGAGTAAIDPVAQARDTVRRKTSWEDFAISNRELTEGIAAPSPSRLYEIVDGSKIASKALLDHVLAQERSSVTTGAAVAFLSQRQESIATLIATYVPARWSTVVGEMMRIINKMAQTELYFKVHLPIIDQILPTSGREPTVPELYSFMVEKYATKGFPFLVTFFRAKGLSTDWPARLMEHVNGKTGAQIEALKKELTLAEQTAAALGPIPTIDRNVSFAAKIEIVAKLFGALLIALPVGAAGWTGYSIFFDDGEKLDPEKLKNAVEGLPAELIPGLEEKAANGDRNAREILQHMRSAQRRIPAAEGPQP